MTIRNNQWMDRALCAQVGGDLWFPGKGENPHAAQAVCARCPVQTACRDYALAEFPSSDEADHGLWGNTSPRDRRALRKDAA